MLVSLRLKHFASDPSNPNLRRSPKRELRDMDSINSPSLPTITSLHVTRDTPSLSQSVDIVRVSDIHDDSRVHPV